MSAYGESLSTNVTRLFGIKYPILLAGMNKASGPKLAAAVTNAGGLGVIGGLNMSPRILQMTINNVKKHLDNEDAIFGVDLLLPKVGGLARKTNYDYTKGKLDKLIDIICANSKNIKLFVCAVGTPPKSVIDRLHASGILVMNMVGHPKHAGKACALGVDLLCAQGGEGGGHTGHVPTSLLVPKCADIARRFISPMTSRPVLVVAAGGIYDGRGLAMALSLGADAVWVGTRFVASVESQATNSHKQAILKANYDDTLRTLVYTGRPLRIVNNAYVDEWETKRSEEMKKLLKEGTIPMKADSERILKMKESERRAVQPHLSGQVAGAIADIKSAEEIIWDMMSQAIRSIRANSALIKPLPSKL